jgi:hypothetical protein
MEADKEPDFNASAVELLTGEIGPTAAQAIVNIAVKQYHQII